MTPKKNKTKRKAKSENTDLTTDEGFKFTAIATTSTKKKEKTKKQSPFPFFCYLLGKKNFLCFLGTRTHSITICINCRLFDSSLVLVFFKKGAAQEI